MTDFSLLRHQVLSRLPTETAIDIRPIDDYTQCLFPVEIGAVSGAVPKRKFEFSTGRASARAALGAVGCPPQPIPMGANREPVWPSGFRGAITHDLGICVAIATREQTGTRLGIDLTENTPLERALLGLVCVTDEIAHIEQSKEFDIDIPKLVFSAKESLYKVLFPIVDRYVDFSEVRLQLNLETGKWKPEFLNPHLGSRLRQPIEGRFVASDRCIVTTAWASSKREHANPGESR